jgi:hypothetical protein
VYELDPVALFKSAADERRPDPKHEKKVRKKLDAGEEAVAGFNMMTTGLAMAVPAVASIPIASYGLGNAVKWEGAAIRGVKRLGDVKPEIERFLAAEPGQITHEQVGRLFRTPDTQKFMGLFDIHIKPRLGPSGAPLLSETEVRKLNEIQPIVDSFLEKYQLPEKGVTMDFRRSPLGAVRGAYYDPALKRVTMPQVSKEVMLHELGHAADYTGRAGALKNVAQNIVPALMIDGLIPAAYFIGDEIKKAIPGTVDDRVIDYVQRHGPGLAVTALAAESLYPEAKASYMALKHIHEVEGAEAAKAAAKRLIPLFGTYVLTSLPIVAGFALAKKYYYDTHRKKQAREKRANVGEEIVEGVKGLARSGTDIMDALADTGIQILRGTAGLIGHPEAGGRIMESIKHVATSPEFRAGAVLTGIPVAVTTLAYYSHPGGKAQRDKLFKIEARKVREGTKAKSDLEELREHRKFEVWREEHPRLYAGLVAAGSALTGGIYAKMMSDLYNVM